MATLSSELLTVLACPLCKGNVLYNKKKNQLSCKQCDKTYHVKNGIPVMLP